MSDPDSNRLNYQGELFRKGLHLLALSYPVGFVLIGRPVGLWIALSLSLLALSLDFLRTRSKAVYRFFDFTFGFMMRANEREVLGGTMVINGATWVAVSFTLLVFFFPEDLAIVSFALFMIGDAVAAIVGRRWGRTQWARRGCTVEGSVAFFFAGLAMAFGLASTTSAVAFYDIEPLALIGGVAVACLLEATPLPINDNLIAPLGAALSMLAITALV
jgi:dolichol kinase